MKYVGDNFWTLKFLSHVANMKKFAPTSKISHQYTLNVTKMHFMSPKYMILVTDWVVTNRSNMEPIIFVTKLARMSPILKSIFRLKAVLKYEYVQMEPAIIFHI